MSRTALAGTLCILMSAFGTNAIAQSPVSGQTGPTDTPFTEAVEGGESQHEMDRVSDKLPGSLKLLIVMSIFSLAPALMMMTTCFVRFSIVFGLLKQAIGTPSIPPPQVMSALSLFLTFLVMAPVWQQSYDNGVKPYLERSESEQPMGEYDAFQQAMIPLRDFMGNQIEHDQNQDAVWLFWDYHSQRAATVGSTLVEPTPENYQDLPLSVLLPAFLVSELKTAFLIGFQIFLPFLVIDLLISSVLSSAGLMMLPPVLVSLPFKLMLFVLIDGWTLIAGTMLEGITPLAG